MKDIMKNIISSIEKIVLNLCFIYKYWESILGRYPGYKINKTFFQCFLAFTSYLIATLLYSISFYAFRFEDGVVACFIVSIILLAFLTYRMIGVYFGKDTIKEQLKLEYRWKYLNAIRGYYQQRNAVNYVHKEIHENEAEYSHKQITAIDFLYNHINTITQNEYDYDSVLDEHAKFLEITSELKEKTLQALENGEVSVVQENMELLSYAKDGETFREILNSIIVAKPDFAVDLLMKYKKESVLVDWKKSKESICNKRKFV